tara:strand:+ start:3611 stop:4609 length:999 start_codon:yes stop_codon:yes gene_type:complete
MAALGSQSIASSYEQLLHVDADGGGNGTTHVSVKDGDNGTTFGFTIATDALMMTGTNRLEFGDTGTYIHQSADGVLDLVSDTELELNATTIDMNGAVVQDGGNFTINEDSGDYDFRVEANGNDSALVMDGGQGFVGIGASKPGYINADDSSGNGDHRGGNTQTTSGSGGLLHINGLVPRIILEDTGDNPHYAIEAQDYFRIIEVSDSATTETSRLNIASDGVVTITAGTVTSDKELKENIEPINNGLNIINQLEGKTFTWKDSAKMPKGTKYGLIAQEIEKVLPDLVYENGGIHEKEDGSYYKSVNMDGVIPILIQAVKELSLIVDELKEKD